MGELASTSDGSTDAENASIGVVCEDGDEGDEHSIGLWWALLASENDDESEPASEYNDESELGSASNDESEQARLPEVTLRIGRLGLGLMQSLLKNVRRYLKTISIISHKRKAVGHSCAKAN